jgi:hypothetical protein
VQVYGHRTFPLDLQAFVHRFAASLQGAPHPPPREQIVEWLVDLAEAESAVADALCPERDDEVPALEPWREALHLLTDQFCWADGGDLSAAGALDRLRRTVATLPLPSTGRFVRGKVAEGFSCYALYPEQYVDAAGQIVAAGDDRPVVCIGIRSIGSVLAAVVASSLRLAGLRVDTRTVRPRGHPFDRRLVLGSSLERFFGSHRDDRFVVVDEGPGISGSSFAAVVDMLTRLGVHPERVTLVPSWCGRVEALRSDRARDAFSRCRVIVGSTPVEEMGRTALGDVRVHDISAGRWRQPVPGGQEAWPAVQPQHERVKYLSSDRATPLLARFAGLGRHGRAKLTRAGVLHDEGFGPRPVAFCGGFLVREWIGGVPLSVQTLAADHVERLADYIALTRKRFALSEVDRGDDLAVMLRQNAVEGLGAECRAAVEQLIEGRGAAEHPKVAVDGRMLPHEWIVTPDSRLLKVDALDHHADDFFPGCRDIAWDVAGAGVELQLSIEARHRLVARYVQLTGDRSIRERLPFFTGAYLAYRLGYATLAAESLGETPDGKRFTGLQERYRRSLAALVAHPHQVARR